MAWVDVTSVRRTNGFMVLQGLGGKIVVSTESFYDTQAAVQYIESHCRKDSLTS
jgi:hypothetical protein